MLRLWRKEASVAVRIGWFVGVIGLVGLIGCAGTGEVVTLKLAAVPPGAGAPIQNEDALRVVVEDFQDQRPKKDRLGVRTHLGGGVTYFDVADGKVGAAVAQAVAEFLTHKGWKVRTAASGTAEPADVTMSGQVNELAVAVKSRFFSTKLAVALKIDLQAVNASDKSRAHLTLEGSRSTTVFWFEPDDVQALANQVIRESLEKMAAEMKVEHRLLRVK